MMRIHSNAHTRALGIYLLLLAASIGSAIVYVLILSGN